MAKEADTAEAAKEETVNFADALATKGGNAPAGDPDPFEPTEDDDSASGGSEPATTEPTDEEKAEKEKADAKTKWDADRQQRDEARAERLKATEVRLEGLTTMVEDLSKTNRALLAQLVQGAGKTDDDAETPSPEPAALATAISELDPENVEFADLVPALNALIKDAKGNKATSAELRKALADQEKRNKEELAKQASRHDDRDTRDANRAAQDAVSTHLDALMLSLFEGKQAMRKTVEKRAKEIIAKHGYDPKEEVPLRTANMALTSAADEVAARLAAEKRDRENPVNQDTLASGVFADDLGKGAQNMQEATKTMGSRAL